VLVVDAVEGRSLLFAAARLSSVAVGRGLPSGKPRAPSGGLAACAARLPFAYLVRRGGWANSLCFAALKHAQPISPRLPSVALGGLNGARGSPLGKPLPTAGDIFNCEDDSSDAGVGLRASLYAGDALLSSMPGYATGDAYSAGASLIPKFRDHYVQTI